MNYKRLESFLITTRKTDRLVLDLQSRSIRSRMSRVYPIYQGIETYAD